MLDDGTPQDQHIDPGIAALRRGIVRHGERRLGRRRPPGLHPGDAAGLQLGDDLVGDFVVKARPVVAGASVGRYVWTSRFSATGAGSLSSRPSTRHGKPGPHSHSQRRWHCAGKEKARYIRAHLVFFDWTGCPPRTRARARDEGHAWINGQQRAIRSLRAAEVRTKKRRRSEATRARDPAKKAPAGGSA